MKNRLNYIFFICGAEIDVIFPFLLCYFEVGVY